MSTDLKIVLDCIGVARVLERQPSNCDGCPQKGMDGLESSSSVMMARSRRATIPTGNLNDTDRVKRPPSMHNPRPSQGIKDRREIRPEGPNKIEIGSK